MESFSRDDIAPGSVPPRAFARGSVTPRKISGPLPHAAGCTGVESLPVGELLASGPGGVSGTGVTWGQGMLAAGAAVATERVVVTGAVEFGWGSVSEAALLPGCVTARCLQAGSVTGRALAAGCVESRALADGCVTAEALAPGCVTAEALADASVEAAALHMLAPLAVPDGGTGLSSLGPPGSVLVGAGSNPLAVARQPCMSVDPVTGRLLVSGLEVSGDLAAQALSLPAGCVRSLATASVTARALADGSVGAEALGEGCVGEAALGAAVVGAEALAPGCVTASKLAPGCVGPGHLLSPVPVAGGGTGAPAIPPGLLVGSGSSAIAAAPGILLSPAGVSACNVEAADLVVGGASVAALLRDIRSLLPMP